MIEEKRGTCDNFERNRDKAGNAIVRNRVSHCPRWVLRHPFSPTLLCPTPGWDLKLKTGPFGYVGKEIKKEGSSSERPLRSFCLNSPFFLNSRHMIIASTILSVATVKYCGEALLFCADDATVGLEATPENYSVSPNSGVRS